MKKGRSMQRRYPDAEDVDERQASRMARGSREGNAKERSITGWLIALVALLVFAGAAFLVVGPQLALIGVVVLVIGAAIFRWMTR